MNKIKKNELYELKDFLILWGTQSVSQLGSSITAFALTLWLYEKTGSSLSTAALTICSYAPYVFMSIFAGALTDRFDKKKTMLVCDCSVLYHSSMGVISYKSFGCMAFVRLKCNLGINEYSAATGIRSCHDAYHS